MQFFKRWPSSILDFVKQFLKYYHFFVSKIVESGGETHHQNRLICCADIAIFQFSRWWPSPSWICLRYIWITHEEYFVVSIIVQNALAITAVVLTSWLQVSLTMQCRQSWLLYCLIDCRVALRQATMTTYCSTMHYFSSNIWYHSVNNT